MPPSSSIECWLHGIEMREEIKLLVPWTGASLGLSVWKPGYCCGGIVVWQRLSSDVAKIQTSKSQGLFRCYLHLAKDLLKINFCASFQRDSVFRFENTALSNFPSVLRVKLIWWPSGPSHMLKSSFMAWYYALWMVKVKKMCFRE